MDDIDFTQAILAGAEADRERRRNDPLLTAVGAAAHWKGKTGTREEWIEAILAHLDPEAYAEILRELLGDRLRHHEWAREGLYPSWCCYAVTQNGTQCGRTADGVPDWYGHHDRSFPLCWQHAAGLERSLWSHMTRHSRLMEREGYVSIDRLRKAEERADLAEEMLDAAQHARLDEDDERIMTW